MNGCENFMLGVDLLVDLDVCVVMQCIQSVVVCVSDRIFSNLIFFIEDFWFAEDVNYMCSRVSGRLRLCTRTNRFCHTNTALP